MPPLNRDLRTNFLCNELFTILYTSAVNASPHVCPPSLESVFTLSFVYRCLVCAAVNIGQQLDLGSVGPPPPPPRVNQREKESRPEPPKEDRGVTPTLACKSLSSAAWHVACLWGLIVSSHPPNIPFTGPFWEPVMTGGWQRVRGRANHSHWNWSLHWYHHHQS